MMPFIREFLCFTVFVTVNSDIGYFWHVTDIHWDPTYSSTDLSCDNQVVDHGIFGDFSCDSSWRLVYATVEGMKRLKPDVDFVLWTGDTVPKISEDLSFESQDAILGNVTYLIKQILSGIPVYGSLGGHDYSPYHQYPVGGDLLYNKTFEKWKSWIGGGAIETFVKGAYYTVKLEGNLRIVALNTNLYYRLNTKINGSIPDPAGQFLWLENVLKTSKQNKERVLISGHIPPGIDPIGGQSWMFPRYNERINAIIRKYGDVITGMIFGHEHADNFKVIHDDKNKVTGTVFCAPSVTPRMYHSSANTRLGHNPGLRLFQYDKTNGNLLDFSQYYLDLRKANTIDTEWKIQYNATTEYNIRDLSPSSMSGLASRMTNKTGSEFRTFYKFWTFDGSRKEEICDDDCHAKFYCNFMHLESDKFHDCYLQFFKPRISISSVMTDLYYNVSTEELPNVSKVTSSFDLSPTSSDSVVSQTPPFMFSSKSSDALGNLISTPSLSYHSRFTSTASEEYNSIITAMLQQTYAKTIYISATAAFHFHSSSNFLANFSSSLNTNTFRKSNASTKSTETHAAHDASVLTPNSFGISNTCSLLTCSLSGSFMLLFTFLFII